MATLTSIQGFIARALASASFTSSDGAPSDVNRIGRNNELYVLSPIPSTHLLSDEGGYFVATNTTPGTAFLYQLQNAFSDTVPFVYLQNNDTLKRAYLHFLKIIVTQVPATTTQSHYAVKTDVPRALGTNNTTAIVPVSPNADAANSSVCTVNAQNSATASAITGASAAARVTARGAFGGIPVVGDELVVVFGSPAIGPYPGLTAAQATCPGRKASNAPPVIIKPGGSATFHLWFLGNATTALQYEFELGWWER